MSAPVCAWSGLYKLTNGYEGQPNRQKISAGTLAFCDPKHGHVQLQHLQPETSFRESYRILGETVITVNDYTSGKQFEDAICNAFYPVDLHTKTGVRPKKLKPGIIPTVPLSALVPKDSSNVLVAGRCVSSDRLANSGLRVQASCMAMGQAAGAAAALAVQKQLTPGALPLDELKALLKEHGAILAGESMTVQASEAKEDAVTASSGSGLLFDAGAAAAVGSGKKEIARQRLAQVICTMIIGKRRKVLNLYDSCD